MLSAWQSIPSAALPLLLTRFPKGRKAHLWPSVWWAPTAVCSGITAAEKGGIPALSAFVTARPLFAFDKTAVQSPPGPYVWHEGKEPRGDFRLLVVSVNVWSHRNLRSLLQHVFLQMLPDIITFEFLCNTGCPSLLKNCDDAPICPLNIFFLVLTVYAAGIFLYFMFLSTLITCLCIYTMCTALKVSKQCRKVPACRVTPSTWGPGTPFFPCCFVPWLCVCVFRKHVL